MAGSAKGKDMMDMELELGSEGRGEEKQETELTYLKLWSYNSHEVDGWVNHGGGGVVVWATVYSSRKRGAYLCSPDFISYHGTITSAPSFDSFLLYTSATESIS